MIFHLATFRDVYLPEHVYSADCSLVSLSFAEFLLVQLALFMLKKKMKKYRKNFRKKIIKIQKKKKKQSQRKEVQ